LGSGFLNGCRKKEKKLRFSGCPVFAFTPRFVPRMECEPCDGDPCTPECDEVELELCPPELWEPDPPELWPPPEEAEPPEEPP
jgi:hypothetical protein